MSVSSISHSTFFSPEVQEKLSNPATPIEQIHYAIQITLKKAVEGDFTSTMTSLAEILDEQVLVTLAKYNYNRRKVSLFDNVFNWARLQKDLMPIKNETTFLQRLKANRNLLSPTIIDFIPHLIDTFLEAFTFLDSRKKYTNLWEKSLIIGVACQLFVIPYLIVKTLQPFIVSSVKVYASAAMIIFAGGCLLAGYKKWFKPKPQNVVNCLNMDEILEKEVRGNKVGQTKELSLITSLFLQKKNVLVVGKAGEGKSSLLHHFIQLKKQNKLPIGVQELIPFKLNTNVMRSDVTFGYGQLISATKEQLIKFQNLLMVEGIHELADSPLLAAVIDNFVDDERIQFIATTTEEGYKKLIELDKGQEFERRVKIVRMEGESDEQIELTLNELINETAENIHVTKNAIQDVIKIAQSPHFLNKTGAPAKATEIMKEAIWRCKTALSPNFVCTDLCVLKQKLELIGAKLKRGKNQLDLAKFDRLTKRCQALQAQINQDNKIIEKIKTLVEMKLKFKDTSHTLGHQIANAADQATISKKNRNLFLLYDIYFQKVFDNVISQEMATLKGRRHLVVDQPLIKRIFAEFKQKRTKKKRVNNE